MNRIVDRIPNKKIKVLEVGVGGGRIAIELAKKNSLNEIIGVDISRDKVAKTQNKINRMGFKNVNVYAMDGTKLTFDEGEFDVVYVSYMLHEVPFDLMIAVIQNIRKVLKKDGLFLIHDYANNNKSRKESMFLKLTRLYEPAHIKEFIYYDWQTILNNAGFQISAIDKYKDSALVSAFR
ncbi:class I SAM-dependent methyltransferase [Bacillus sp. NTK034]|uniref:class I SAM-dependent methyltransferase n=1 Tax=Bacillus sp. NTK034 TaxID=2802176 RepID=UPI001A8FE003|nr:class I SAM-dependent methyltransferase [Bacillus sp. NTK034]MBN8200041.1 class I SAM-dependent methyltransferase [Bacillus sp. NTK034]